MAKPPSPTPANIRLTITVTPEVHAAFVRMAQVASLPIGRCMGEWLGDTLEGVEFLTAQLERAREAPRQVVKEMRQLALGSADLADELLRDMRAGKVGAPALAAGGDAPPGARRPTAAAAQETPRLVIRGGKSPGKTRTR